MGPWLAGRIAEHLSPKSRILVLGLTFKENVPDLRNSKVIDVIRGLRQRGHEVQVHDPYADAAEAAHEYGETVTPSLSGLSDFDCLVAAVPHDPYGELTDDAINTLVKSGGLIADIKGLWRNRPLPGDKRVWRL
jgi:UDP-N-acetyl-D-galactosamine dehydrogenase